MYSSRCGPTLTIPRKVRLNAAHTERAFAVLRVQGGHLTTLCILDNPSSGKLQHCGGARYAVAMSVLYSLSDAERHDITIVRVCLTWRGDGTRIHIWTTVGIRRVYDPSL